MFLKITFKVSAIFSFLIYRRKRKKLVFIYGEPRSGISFITRLIAGMGLSPRPFYWLQRGDKHNPDGYYECTPIQNRLDSYIDEQGVSFENYERISSLKINDSKTIRFLKKTIKYGRIEVLNTTN